MAIEDCFKCPRNYDCELRVVRPNGEERVLHSRGLVIFNEAGEPLRMIGAAQDITRQFTENISEVLWLAAPDLRSIIYVSPAYRTRSGAVL
jgi:hypothetical protein